MTEYELVRSRRKTLSVQVTRECRVIVRAPLRLAKREIDRFVFEHADWIARGAKRVRVKNVVQQQTPDIGRSVRKVIKKCV